MKGNELRIGGYYRAKVSGVETTVKLDAIRKISGRLRDEMRYDVTNMKTGRRTTFRSAAKFREPAGGEHRSDPTKTSILHESLSTASSSDHSPQSIQPSGGARTSRTTDVGVMTAEPSGSSNGFSSTELVAPTDNRLKGDQATAFGVIASRIVAGEKVTKLCGYAGTGKTYLLARVAEWVKTRTKDVTIAAPTHKAAGVIQEKLGADVDVRTIHSLLGMKLEPDYENDTGGRVLKAGERKLNKGLVICDEASMVGSELAAEIAKVPGVQWLFVGDLAQLPPVGEDTSCLLDEPDATLRQVLRQANGSEILRLATAIREGDVSMEFEPGRDVYCVSNAEDLFQAALERFRSDEYTRDAAHARMLVFRNDRRKAINQRMRDLLVNSPDPYTPGEWLVMYAAFSPEKSRLNVLAEKARNANEYSRGREWRKFFDYKTSLGNNITQLHVSEEVRVKSVTDQKVQIGEWAFDVHSLVVSARQDSEHTLPVLCGHEVDRLQQIKDDHAGAATAARAERDLHQYGTQEWMNADDVRKRAWSIFFALDETFAQVDYAYAMTVHKSQGSTFDHAFVDVPDLLCSGDMAQRILYTAVTRPAKSLTFYK